MYHAALFPVVHVSTDAREIRAREDRSAALDRLVNDEYGCGGGDDDGGGDKNNLQQARKPRKYTNSKIGQY